jgi:hypothetical protein
MVMISPCAGCDASILAHVLAILEAVRALKYQLIHAYTVHLKLENILFYRYLVSLQYSNLHGGGGGSRFRP